MYFGARNKLKRNRDFFKTHLIHLKLAKYWNRLIHTNISRRSNNNNNNYKLLLRQYPRNESCPVAHLVQRLGEFIVRVRRKIPQQMIGCGGNLGNSWEISESETVRYRIVTERNYAIRWLNVFRSEFQRVGTATLGTDDEWKISLSAHRACSKRSSWPYTLKINPVTCHRVCLITYKIMY